MVEFLTLDVALFKRHIKSKIIRAVKSMPVVLLRGARQTGKTTLAKSALDGEYNYISFDHVPSLITAKEDPVGFISRIQKPVVLDEIQRVPELFLPIKADVDENREAGRYLLTGSADPLLIPKLGDSLAGRMRLLTLWPLSQGEIRGKEETFLHHIFTSPLTVSSSENCSKEELLQLVTRGGYPAPLQMKTEQESQDWFNDYISLILQKDVLDLSKIENITQMPHLLMLLGTRVGGLLNVEELTRTIRLSTMTLHRYLDLLRALFLVHFVPAWSKNFGKRLVKSPKVYLNDTAMQLFLMNVDKKRLAQDSYLFGSVVENFVVLEILKQISWSDQLIQLYHYRDYNRSEVDILLEGPGGDVVGIEVKSSETVTSNDFKRLKQLQESVGKQFIQGIVLYAGDKHIPFGEKLTASPISTLWGQSPKVKA